MRLRQALPGARDLYQAQCPDCQLAMRRHHAYRRSIMTGYGAVALWIPVFRCGECRRVGWGCALSSVLKKTGETALKLAALGLSCAAASGWVGRLSPVGKRRLIRPGSTVVRWRRTMWRAMVSGPSQRAGKWSMGGRFPISCATVPLSFAAGIPAQSGLGRLDRRATAAGVGQRDRRAAAGAAGGGLDRRAGGILVPKSLA